MQTISLQELVSHGDLQQLQDKFCAVTGVCACCLNKSREKLTVLSESGQEIPGIQQYFQQEAMEGLLERLAASGEDNTAGDQIIEELEKGRMAALAVRSAEDVVLYWIVLQPDAGETERLGQVLGLLREMCRIIFKCEELYGRIFEKQASTDFLTGLYNRMCCERDLAKLVEETKQNGTKGAVVYLDLDDFKNINEGLGHQYGDVLLKSISRSLQGIQGIQNTCYRMGGDEFVIVIPPESYERFEKIVDDVRQMFSKSWFLKDTDYYCTTSMGVVTFPDEGESFGDLIKKADIAMYESKRGGKNRSTQYRKGQISVSGRRLDMEKYMRNATLDGYQEFEVYYQPIIDIQNKTKRCAGAEALIRWNSTKMGFVSPAEFIPLAEYLGLINPIGNHVLEEACRCCREWNEQGHPDYKVNVNLSVVQLLQTDIVESVENILKKTELNPKNLTLEVTESLAINDMTRMKVILNRIKELGVSLALDDFGTGYSSLNHIREIPIDVIKVDQSFVKGLAEDVYSQSFIKMVAELAQTIGVNICVEGIETREQYKVLRGMKIKYIQGYYFDRPMPRKLFEARYVD